MAMISVFCCLSQFDVKAEESDKIVEKYEKWKEAVNNPKDSKKVFAFFYNNPHWPLFEKSIREAEKYAKSKVSKKMALKWFRRYQPKTKEGLEFYIQCLLDDNPQIAKKYIKQTWIFQNLAPEFMNEYKSEFSNYLSPVEDAKKTKKLMKGMQLKQLSVLKEIVIDEIADYISDFIEKHISSRSGGYSKRDLEDIDRKYEIIQRLIDKKQDRKAGEILSISNRGEEEYATSFFNKRRHVAYNLLRAGDPQLAYRVMQMCKLNSKKKDEKIAKMEWLLGYISFRFFNDFKKSAKHFKKAYDNSLNSIRISKNAFWLAEVYKRRNDIIPAVNWYKKASKYFSTFYGYLSERRLTELSPQKFSERSVSDESRIKDNLPSASTFNFYNRELVRVLLKVKDKSMRKYFYQQLIYEIEDPNEEMMLMDIAIVHDEVSFLIAENSKRQHYFSNDGVYRVLSPTDIGYVKRINSDPFFISLVHSVIQRESNFNPNARSHVGAIGLMQIMPSTARHEAKRLKFYMGGSLFNRQKNITLGAGLLNRLLKKYNGNVIFAVAAYNMGEGGVASFKKSLQNIDKLKPIDIIELIPFKETRLYVKHVLRSLFSYQKKFTPLDDCKSCRIILHDKDITI